MAIFNTVYGGTGYKTFTIKWEEKSDMSSWWVYSDDATWLTAGDSKFDDFFWYRPVLLNTSWVVAAELNPNDFTKDTSWNSVNISSWDNVMIEFPIRWIKMSKSWSNVTLSITDKLNASWFQYYAHSRWTLASPVAKDNMYMWVYEWYVNSSVLKSWSGKTPTWNQTMSTYITNARANDGNTWSWWYDISWFYQLQYIIALYMMKYGNPNMQSVIGYWYNWQWQTTGATNSVGMNWATASWNTGRVKLFWLEDMWWNNNDWVWWLYVNSWNINTALSWFTDSWWTSYTNISSAALSSWKVQSIIWSNNAMFFPNGFGNDVTTYYCAGWSVNNWIYDMWWAAHWDMDSLFFSQRFTASTHYNDIWARLMYL